MSAAAASDPLAEGPTLPPPEPAMPGGAASAVGDAAWAPLRFHAPTRSGQIVLSDGLPAASREALETQRRLASENLDLQGRSLARLRSWAREDCLHAAGAYTSQITGEQIEPADASAPLFAGGHQPALFHTGVWIKNFVLGDLAARVGGTGLNLVVDNDTLSTRGVKAPSGTREQPGIEWLPFDAPCAAQPWEDATIADRTVFRSFADRAVETMSQWGIHPIVREMWPQAVRRSSESDSLSDCLTAARQFQERSFGLQNLELPLSTMCRQPAFLWFASHLLAHLPRFREIHNDVLWQYRKVNRIRSRSHPVPELAEQGGWLEAPFWMWRRGQEHRRQVFARQNGKQLQLSDGDSVFANLRLTPEMDACCAVEGLQRLSADGIRFRTRALTTTLFARLCLSDLFVHGIGGAKYDEMTDQIIQRFFGVETPKFLMATATLHLPLGMPHPVTESHARQLRHKLRDARFNPERYPLSEDIAQLVSRKRELIAHQKSASKSRLSVRQRRQRRAENRRRYLEFLQVNSQVAAHGREYRTRLAAELCDVEDQLAANKVLQDREYSYALHPEESLRSLIASLATENE